MLKHGIYYMELYFIMKTIPWETVSVSRQTYNNVHKFDHEFSTLANEIADFQEQ